MIKTGSGSSTTSVGLSEYRWGSRGDEGGEVGAPLPHKEIEQIAVRAKEFKKLNRFAHLLL